MKPHSSRVRKWNNWLDKIVQEVGRLQTFVEIRRDFARVVEQSPVKGTRDAFWTYLGFALLDELVIRAVRICDRQSSHRERRVYSLRALLEECRDHHEYFTRRRFVGRKNPPPAPPPFRGRGPRPVSALQEFRNLNATFDSLVNPGVDQLSKKEIEKDIERLDLAIRKLKTFRNKFVAHNDFRKRARKAPSFDEIPSSLQVISELTRRYYRLITKSDIALDSYVFHTDITRLFSKPWIASEKDRRQLQAEFKKRRRT